MTPKPREVRRRVRVGDPDGLHARPCALVARAAEAFASRIVVAYARREANARSVLELLSLGVLARAEVDLIVTGEDAVACAAAIAARLEAPAAPAAER